MESPNNPVANKRSAFGSGTLVGIWEKPVVISAPPPNPQVLTPPGGPLQLIPTSTVIVSCTCTDDRLVPNVVSAVYGGPVGNVES